MAEEFDIEAYLEAAVDGSAKGQQKNEENKNGSRSDVERKRSRSHSKERRQNRDRDRDRDRHRDRDRDRDRRRRRSSRSRDRRSRSRSRSGGRRRRRDDRRRSRSRSRSRGRDRDGSRRKEKEADVDKNEKEAENTKTNTVNDAESLAARDAERRQKAIDDLTKDQRTVFVSQLTAKVDEKKVKDYFSQVGDVNNVIMIRDKFTGRHKGFAYVEMKELESIPTCLMLNGVPPDFQKFPILVKASEAEKNFLARKDPASVAPTHASMGQGGSSASNSTSYGEVGDSRVYVGNLHVNITEEDLSTVLQQVGPVESVHISRDEVGTSKGYAFARFKRVDDAHKAQSTLSGLELAGRSIKVGFVTDGGGNQSSSGAVQYSGSSNWKLDDDEGSGMQMNSQSRSMLMAKLGKAAGLELPKPSVPPPAPVSNSVQQPPAITGRPSACFIMKNMFVLEEETEKDWEEYIKEDVTVECQKFGAVEQCYVDKKRPGGLIYIKFASSHAASEAANSLNGRWFAGRMITIEYIDQHHFASLIENR